MWLLSACFTSSPPPTTRPVKPPAPADTATLTTDTGSPPIFGAAPTSFAAVAKVEGRFDTTCSATYIVTGTARAPTCPDCLFSFDVTSTPSETDGFGCDPWWLAWGGNRVSEVTLDYLPTYTWTYDYTYDEPRVFNLTVRPQETQMDVYGGITGVPKSYTWNVLFGTHDSALWAYDMDFGSEGFAATEIHGFVEWEGIGGIYAECTDTVAALPARDTLAATVAEGTTYADRAEVYALDLVVGNVVDLSVDGDKSTAVQVIRPDNCIAAQAEEATPCALVVDQCPAGTFVADTAGTWHLAVTGDSSAPYVLGLEVDGVPTEVDAPARLALETYDSESEGSVGGGFGY